jgi:hypothetical protein
MPELYLSSGDAKLPEELQWFGKLALIKMRAVYGWALAAGPGPFVVEGVLEVEAERDDPILRAERVGRVVAKSS